MDTSLFLNSGVNIYSIFLQSSRRDNYPSHLLLRENGLKHYVTYMIVQVLVHVNAPIYGHVQVSVSPCSCPSSCSGSCVNFAILFISPNFQDMDMDIGIHQLNRLWKMDSYVLIHL
jgi:hypothetical protein